MRSIFLFIALVISISLNAQQKLVFTQAGTAKTVQIKKNALVRFAYYGYLKQVQESEGVVSAVTDSSITLSPRKKFLQKAKAAQTMLLRDITGFRLYSRFRPAGEVIYAVAGIGITGTVTAIISSASVPAALSFLSAAGTSALTMGLRNIFFSTKIKNHLNAGWVFEVKPGP